MNNEKEKNGKGGGEKLRIQKPYNAEKIMKLIWKMHEVVRGKSPL